MNLFCNFILQDITRQRILLGLNLTRVLEHVPRRSIGLTAKIAHVILTTCEAAILVELVTSQRASIIIAIKRPTDERLILSIGNERQGLTGGTIRVIITYRRSIAILCLWAMSIRTVFVCPNVEKTGLSFCCPEPIPFLLLCIISS